jgi:hypothetical protein
MADKKDQKPSPFLEYTADANEIVVTAANPLTINEASIEFPSVEIQSGGTITVIVQTTVTFDQLTKSQS